MYALLAGALISRSLALYKRHSFSERDLYPGPPSQLQELTLTSGMGVSCQMSWVFVYFIWLSTSVFCSTDILSHHS